MKYIASGQADAQAMADKIHQALITPGTRCYDKFYAQSVAAGHTKRWAAPTRDVDDKGQPVGDWFIAVEARCLEAFTATEKDKLDDEGKAVLAARVSIRG